MNISKTAPTSVFARLVDVQLNIKRVTATLTDIVYDHIPLPVTKVFRNIENHLSFKFIPNKNDLNTFSIEFNNSNEIFDEAKLYKKLLDSRLMSEMVSSVRITVDESILSTINCNEECPLFEQMASFIAKIFDACPNAFILEFCCSIGVFYLITKQLKVPNIEIMKLSFTENQKADIHFDMAAPIYEFEKLPLLKEIHFSTLDDDTIISPPSIIPVYENILKQIPKNKNIKVILIDRNTHSSYPYIFEMYLVGKKYEINFGLHGGIFFKILPTNFSYYEMDNLVEGKISIKDMETLKMVLTILPNLKNFKTLSISFCPEMFRQIYDNREEIRDFKDYFEFNLWSNLQTIEKLHLCFNDYKLVYKESPSYGEVLLIMKNMAEHIMTNLGESIKILKLEGIHFLTKKMGTILSDHCKNLVDLYLYNIKMVNVHFLEDMESLKFVYLNSFFSLNMPNNVEMVIVRPEIEEKISIGTLDGEEFYDFIQEAFNKIFQICFDTFLNEKFEYCVLFENVLKWDTYLKKIDSF
uniref:F-box domain-containing protein n=1 Tax=Parastrongyloides trichosuri TaxID=131310 RepID=A0A0N4ZL24_PARTI